MKDKHFENKTRIKENIVVACSVGAILIAFGSYISVQNDVPDTYAETAYNYPEFSDGSGNRTSASRYFAGFETEEEPVISHTQNPDGGYDIVVDYTEGTLDGSRIDELVDEYIEEHADELYARPSQTGPEQENDQTQAPEEPAREEESPKSVPARDDTQEPASEQPSEEDAGSPAEAGDNEGTDDHATAEQDASGKKRYVMPGGFVDETGSGTISAASVGSPVYDIASVTWHVLPVEGEAYLSDSGEALKKTIHISDGGAVSLYTETIYEDGGNSLSPSCFIATRGYLKAHGMI